MQSTKNKGRMYEQWCGGEHIALPGEEDGSTFILTAAHCITDVVRMYHDECGRRNPGKVA